MMKKIGGNWFDDSVRENKKKNVIEKHFNWFRPYFFTVDLILKLIFGKISKSEKCYRLFQLKLSFNIIFKFI